MKTAKSLDEFLFYARRKPTAVFYDESEYEYVEGNNFDTEFRKYKGRELFDDDATDVFNGKLPLPLMIKAATERALPEGLRSQIALASWARAVLIKDDKAASELARILEGLHPEMKGDLGEYLSAQNIEDREFAAAFIMLKNPGIKPFLEPGIGRTVGLGGIENFRDNWWCAVSKTKPENLRYREDNRAVIPDNEVVQFPAFIRPEERDAANKEWIKLGKMDTGASYLPRIVLKYAASHPRDPRIAEALHLAVRATRYGCIEDESESYACGNLTEVSRLSKAAFTLLHKKYSKSQWAKKTPYWF